MGSIETPTERIVYHILYETVRDGQNRYMDMPEGHAKYNIFQVLLL